MVTVLRVRCLTCHRSFRVYPRGVGRGQQSSSIKALSVLLYALGLSCSEVSLVLEVFGSFLGKSTIHRNIQEAGPEVQSLRADWLRGGLGPLRVEVPGAMKVRCIGKLFSATVAANNLAGIEVSLDMPDVEESRNLERWVRQLANGGTIQFFGKERTNNESR